MLVLWKVPPRRKPYVSAQGLPLLSGGEEGYAVPVIPFQVAHDSNPTLKKKLFAFRQDVQVTETRKWASPGILVAARV